MMFTVNLRLTASVNLIVNVFATEKSIESATEGVTDTGVMPDGY